MTIGLIYSQQLEKDGVSVPSSMSSITSLLNQMIKWHPLGAEKCFWEL